MSKQKAAKKASLVRDKKTQRPRGMAFVSLVPRAPEADQKKRSRRLQRLGWFEAKF